jgi:hypothetical protein
VKADFVPLALRAPLVNGHHRTADEAEAAVYARLKPAMLAPQGLGILNTDGQVLLWVQVFDDDKSIAAFLDRAVERYASSPDATGDVVAHRYAKFPANRVDDLPMKTSSAGAPDRHAKGATCPARAQDKSLAPKGHLAATLVGRALTDQGALHPDTIRQEHYAQDHFSIPPKTQRAIALALEAGGERIALPDDLGRLVATSAHLGHIDVRPLFGTNRGTLSECEFVASPAGDGLWRLEGRTTVTAKLHVNGEGVHDVALRWTGFLATADGRIARLLLCGEGREKLVFENGVRDGDEASFLPGGRRIDQECGVRYGIVAVPGTNEESANDRLEKAMEGLHDAIRKQLEPLVRAGDIDAAEKLLLELRRRIEK